MLKSFENRINIGQAEGGQEEGLSELENAKKEMQETINKNGRSFGVFAKDSSLRYIPSDGFYFLPEKGEIHSDVEWFMENDFTQDEAVWAHYHEIAHFRDMRENPDEYLKNFEYIRSQAKETAKILEQKYRDKYEQSNPKLIENLTAQIPRDKKKPEKGVMSRLDNIAYKYHHKFFNVLDDIYVNADVENGAPKYSRGPGKELTQNLYAQKLFEEKNYQGEPKHIQFVNSLIRKIMTGEECELDAKVEKELEEFMILGKTMNDFIGEMKRIKNPGERYDFVKDNIEPFFGKLLKEDLENIDLPDINNEDQEESDDKGDDEQSNDDGENKESGDKEDEKNSEEEGESEQGNEQGESEGEEGSSDESGEEGDEHGESASEEGGSDESDEEGGNESGTSGDSESTDGEESGESGEGNGQGGDPLDPFNDNYDGNNNGIPGPVGEGDVDIEDILEQIKEQNEKKEEEKNMSPEDRKKKKQAESEAEFDAEHEINSEIRKKYKERMAEIEPYKKEMEKFWKSLISKAAEEFKRIPVDEKRKGKFNSEKKLVKKYIEAVESMQTGDSSDLKVMERKEQVKVSGNTPELIKIRIIGDLSGSMDNAKRKVQEQAMLLLLSSLSDFNTYLNNSRRDTHSKLKIDTEAWVFGDGHHRIKDFSGRRKKDDQADIINIFKHLDQNLKWTKDYALLEEISSEIKGKEQVDIKKGKTMEIVFEITDGVPYDGDRVRDTDTKYQIDELTKKGVITRGFQIGKVDKEDQQTFDNIWNTGAKEERGKVVGADIKNLPKLLIESMKKHLGNIQI